MTSKEYVGWLNDKDLMRFTEVRFQKHTMQNVKKYVSEIYKSKTDFLYGAFVQEKNKKIHIGNIKLGGINSYHKFADIAYIIGNRDYIGKGYGKLLIKAISNLAKKKFKLKQIIAGVYDNNIASKKVLLANGFKLTGIIKKQFKYRNKYVDHCLYRKFLD